MNPCIACHRLPNDKNEPECVNCKKRLEYVQHLNSQPWGSESILKKETRVPERAVDTIEGHDAQPMSPGQSDPPAQAPSIQKPKRRLCSEPGCGMPHLAKGFCYKHYHEQRKLKKADKAKASSVDNGENKKTNMVTFKIDNDLYDRIERIAFSELRTPENQAIYMLKSACIAYEQERMVEI